MSLVNELKRRGVVRVVLAYLAAAWLLLQIADLVLPAYGFSDEAMAILINVIVIGVVPAAIFAWVFEWTPEGIARDTGQAIPASRARHMDRAIIVVLLLAVAYFAADKFWLRPAVELEIDKSIAVLPFINMSSDPEQEYFSDGISEELLNLLAKVKELRVISRSSSFAYRGEEINIPEVADALNVGYVLEGSVRKAGNRIRITAQLIEGATDRHLWSETYDRDLVDIFAIQDEVSAKIIEELKIELTGEAPHAYRTDPETYALFLRAKARLVQTGLMGDIEAATILEEVVARDPDYVPALSYLSSVHGYVRRNYGDESPFGVEESKLRQKELVERIAELDPRNAMVFTWRAWEFFTEEKDVKRAAAYLDTALALDPSEGDTMRAAAAFAGFIGDHESRMRILQHVLQRDPSCIHCIADYVGELVLLGRLDEAEELARTRLEIAAGGYNVIGQVLTAKGEFEAALEAVAKHPYEGERLRLQAEILFAAGEMAAYEQIKAELNEKYPRRWWVLTLNALEGNTEIVLDALEDNYADDTSMFGFVMRDPTYAFLHGHPRWEALCERAGLSEAQIAGTKLNLPEGF